MSTSRRQFFRLTAGGLVAASGVAAPARPVRAQGPTVRIGTAVLGDYSLTAPTLIALDKGYFRAQGVAAEFQPFRGGPDLVKAVMANQIQIGITGSTDVPVFRAEGVPVRFVATTVDGNHFTFNVAPGIGKLADLKGKSIGVTRVGATTWIFAVMLAKQQGWDPERDVKIVGLGGLDAQLAALTRGEIHAYVWGDGGAVTELQGKSKILLRLDTVTPKWISQSCYCSDEYINGNKDAIARALKAMFQGVRFIRESPKEAFAIAAKTLKWPEEAVGRAHQISGPLLSNDGTINVEAIDVMQTTLLEFKAQKQRVPTADLYTTEFTPVRV
ncbi:MAG: ABC transporter substrate-binding protein [Candidatus Rokubacteria bacterium]|nr:ABC transporter substrate-binding protein [Candidatus Rokubacteria bacterium]